MADYHQIVDQIRMALHGGEPGANGRLAGLASAYAEACAEAAQRLGRCHRLLQQGLRSEAIQLAESEPKLLDALGVLDFPERPEWDDLVQMRGLATAPRIPLEPARLLNEAYAEVDPLQDLLRRHRRLALLRAPLRVRIAVLRQLATRDPGNPIWAEDLRGFEQAWLLQIQDEATEGLRRHDPEWIGRLVAEVEQPIWTEPPPQSLVQSLRKLDAQVKGERAREALEAVAARLDEALNARDPIRGRMARQEWTRLSPAAALAADDPITGRVRPALDWLAEQDRRDREYREHAEALAGLVRALDYPGAIDPVELERLAHDVQGRGDGMPEALRLRYITRLREAEAARARRRLRIVAGSVAATLLVGTLFYLAIHAQVRSQAAADAATAITDQLELGELEQAVALEKKFAEADPELMTYPALVEARQRVEAAQAKESERALQFDKAMREAQAAPVSVKPPPALEAARTLARLDTEKSQVDDLVRRRAAGLQAEEGRREQELTPRLDEVAAAIGRIEARLKADGAGPADDAALLGSIADARRTLTDLASDVEAAGAGARDRAQALTGRLESAGTRLEHRGQQARLESAITAAVAYSPDARGFTEASALAAALQAFGKSFPDSPRSRAFAATLRDQPVWDAIADWDRITDAWRDVRPAVPPQEAGIRAEQCRQFLTQHPASPDSDRAAAYQHAMEAMARRSAEGEGALGKLQRLMTDLLVDNLWMVTVRPPASSGPQNYYVGEQPPRGARSLRYLVGFDGKEKTFTIVNDWVERIDVSPQTKIAGKYKPILARDPAQIDWEATLLDLADQVRNQPGMDPVLRVALLGKVLELGMEGSESLQATLGGLKDRVDKSDVDVNVPWMDPESREAEQMRPRAAAFLKKLPDLAPLRKDVLDRRAKVARLVANHPRAMGWLTREAEGWRIRTGSASPREGALQLAIPGDDGHGAWKTVGIIDQGRPRLTNPDDPALAEGRPVFVTSDGAGGP